MGPETSEEPEAPEQEAATEEAIEADGRSGQE